MSSVPFVTFRRLGRYGRLGNQLFQIAAAIGVATRNGCEAIFPPWSLAKHFACALPQASVIAPARIRVEETFAYQDIRISEPTDLVGHFQSERYFKHCETEIRKLFRPSPDLLDYSRRCLERSAESALQKKTCSVHVRRGDYVNNPYFADLAGEGYYARAIARFPADTAYLVFSDNIPWCRGHFRGRNFYFIEGQSPIVDLVVMGLCTEHIIANSTFSWWGAWLNPRPEKAVIAPQSWFAGSLADPRVPYVAGPNPCGYFDTRDLIPPEWIKL